MRYKRNKYKNKLFTLILSLVAVVLLYFTVSNLPDKPHTATVRNDAEYKTFTYIITEIDDTGYYGESEDGKTGIYFTNEELEQETIVNVGDQVTAIFEPDNLIEMVGVKVNE